MMPGRASYILPTMPGRFHVELQYERHQTFKSDHASALGTMEKACTSYFFCGAKWPLCLLLIDKKATEENVALG
jgi:hypothetical protein